MVRVPGSSGDSGFHRESLEDVQVKIEQGDQASSELGSTTTRLNEVRSSDRQSARRTSVGGTEADPDQEDKPQPPTQVLSGTPVDLDPRQDPPTKQTKAGRERYGFADSMAKPERYISPSRKSTRCGGIPAKQSSTRVKMKAPDPEGEDPIQVVPSWSDVDLEYAFHQKELRDVLALDPRATGKLDAVKGLMSLLKEAGLVAGRFDANDLFDLDLDQIQSSTQGLFDRLKALVGEIQPKTNSAMSDPGLPTHIGSTGRRTASPYVSAAEGSDTSSKPRRMSLGPSGAAILQARSQIQQGEKSKPRPKRQPVASMDPTTSVSDTSASRLETYFQAAMSRFLKEQQALPSPPTPTGIQNSGFQDVEMESTGSPDPDPHWEYDPDDIDLPTTDRAAMATMTTGSTGSTMIQRVRISAISDLKEFSGKGQDEDRARAWLGKGQDEDRARAWLGKVKSAFLRDQASDGEKCLTFADLLSGAARNWYRQLPRSTRNKWTDLLRSFQIQYCGCGVSVARQYYHARRRSDESALEYLHRLNVAGLRARLKIKDGIPKEKREHVDHVIETLGDQELADRLTLLRLPDADELEELLRALDRAKNRPKKSAFGSNKFRQKAPANPAPAAAAKHVRAIQIQAPDYGSDDSGSDDSGSERSDSDCDEHRRIYTAANQDNARSAGEEPNGLDRSQPDRPQHDRATHDHRSRIQNDRSDRSRCTHCGSKKHTDLGCWRRLTCEKCGKRGIQRITASSCVEAAVSSTTWRSRYCIYAFVHKPAVDPGNKQRDLHGNTFDLCGKRTPVVSSVCQANDYSRSSETLVMDLDPGCRRGYWNQRDPDLGFKPAVGEVVTKIPGSSRVEACYSVDVLDLLPGESRGYWKQHSPGKWFRQAKIHGKINNEKAILLLDTGADVSIVDTAFARKVGCYIDRSQRQECVGIGENVYTTEGRTRIKITLAGSLVYVFNIWVGDLSGQEAILGMDFMVPAGIRLDLADGSLCLPDEIRIQLSGRRRLYNDKVQLVKLEQHLQLGVGESAELPVRLRRAGHDKLWVTRGDMHVASQRSDPTSSGIWSAGSRRYMEWQNLALQATTDAGSAMAEPLGTLPESMVERPKYQTPRAILRRLEPGCIPPTEVGPSGNGGRLDKSSLDPTGQPNTKDTVQPAGVTHLQVTPARVSEARRQSPAQRSGPDPDDMVTGERSLDPDPGGDQLKGDENQNPDPATGDSQALLNSTADLGLSSETQDSERARDPLVGEETVLAVAVSSGNHSETGDGPANPGAVGEKKTPDPANLRVLVDGQRKQVVDSHREGDQAPDPTGSLDPGPDDSTADEQVCYHESGDLHAEDVAAEMAVLPEVTSTTEEVTIEDIQVGDPDINTPEEIEHLRRRIWKRRHLLIGKGNALPPAARGVVCDIDVGNVKPIAQRVRKVAPQFREKLSDLIKGLLGAKIISVSTSPWAW
ncbi:unnamed protein product [Phytophthora fragariaefolia]|uniref:Unnamed protein product n=1 Tax=Phytophthora fragariaefolia TaxID=1490495 RepID=A0A9W7CSH2_9STRA|nr:unnamed protein product [Phytophthora fragariaefolia]